MLCSYNTTNSVTYRNDLLTHAQEHNQISPSSSVEEGSRKAVHCVSMGWGQKQTYRDKNRA